MLEKFINILYKREVKIIEKTKKYEKNKNNKNNINNKKGVTLVILVITIVILLIIAGITINVVLDKNNVVVTVEKQMRMSKTLEEIEIIKSRVTEALIDAVERGKTVEEKKRILQQNIDRIKVQNNIKHLSYNIEKNIVKINEYEYEEPLFANILFVNF